MKKTIHTKKILALLLAAVFLLSAAGIAFAANSPQKISAVITPDIRVIIDQSDRTFYNAQGEQVYPLLYNGTTYLPVRAIGEIMKKNVNWDESSLTISLSGDRAFSTSGKAGTLKQQITVPAQIRPDFNVKMDGEAKQFYDANGKAVYPILYSGSTYLPLRAIGQMMGKTVSWNSASKTVSLSAASTVTDADSFHPLPAQQPSTLVDTAKAREIALRHAGLSAADVLFAKVSLEQDDGQYEYEIEFFCGNKEYDYEINAATGAIISYDYDAEAAAPQAGSTSSVIGEAKAREIALAHAGISASSASGMHCKLDRDDGRYEYEVEFYAGGLEYEYTIDAVTGKILEHETDHWD